MIPRLRAWWLVAGMVGSSWLAIGCETCGVNQIGVLVDQPDQELAPLLAACNAKPSNADACQRACRRVFELVAEHPERQELEECKVEVSGGHTWVQVTFTAECG